MINISISKETTPVDATTADSEGVMPTLMRLYRQLQGRAVLLTQCRQDADDLVQRVVERAISHPEVFRPGHNSWGWLSRVMRNMFLDDCRMRRARKTVALDLESMVQPEADAQPSPCDLLTTEDLQEGIAKLPEPQRTLLRLIHFSGCSYREIASRLGIGCNTLGTRLLRARRRLKTVLEGTYRMKVLQMAGVAPAREPTPLLSAKSADGKKATRFRPVPTGCKKAQRTKSTST